MKLFDKHEAIGHKSEGINAGLASCIGGPQEHESGVVDLIPAQVVQIFISAVGLFLKACHMHGQNADSVSKDDSSSVNQDVSKIPLSYNQLFTYKY